MSIWKDKRFAICVMILMIAAGTLIGSHNSLAGKRDKAAVVFTMGVRGDGISIQGDLRERDGAAYNMVVVARKYLPEDNALIQNVLIARGELEVAATVGAKSAANRKLETAVKDLYDVLSVTELSGQDERYPRQLYTDFRSRGDSIGHDPYNQEAAAFNRVLSGFPAGLLGGLTGVKPLELFD
ncbi:MAG: LemA family protein [Clostridiales bacterium]|nr:LemA family protein [Clostridiales bacterium]